MIIKGSSLLVRFVAVSLVVVTFFGITSVPVQAETPSASDFGCSGGGCACKIMFRNKATGEIVSVHDGGTTVGNLGAGIFDIQNGANYEYSILASTPAEETDECYVQQEESNGEINWADLGLESASSLGTGVPIAGSSEINDVIDQITTGNWQGKTKSENFECGWENGQLITEWKNLNEGFDKDRVGRVQLRGHRGGPIADTFVCGMLLTKSGSDLVDFELCKQIQEDTNARTECDNCLDSDGIWTAIGCLSIDATSLIQTLVKVGLSISGGVAVLMFLAAGFMFSTSQGDPKKTSEAKEMMTSAVVGILFIIFSVTILQFIGVNILMIPGFGG